MKNTIRQYKELAIKYEGNDMEKTCAFQQMFNLLCRSCKYFVEHKKVNNCLNMYNRIWKLK